jgi:hypothetical protein
MALSSRTLELHSSTDATRGGFLGDTGLQKAAANCEHPKCSSCQYGKGRRRPSLGKVTKPIPSKEGSLKSEDLFPGQTVSVDHFQSSAKGRLYESFGKTSEDKMYSGGCIFVDHATGYIHVEHQVSWSAAETIAAKHRYERHMLDMGVTVVSYQSDNGTFGAAAFVKELLTKNQHSTYSGVGAHHQNGVVERGIGTIMSMARTMMLHAAVRWPDVADSANWTMAVDYAIYIHNHVPKVQSGFSPIELVTRSGQQSIEFTHLHVWGSPAYVLDPKLQDGKKIPKWKPRTRRAMFMGLSKKYASSIPLVMSCQTLAISAQFHVVFDDWFTTVQSSGLDDEVPEWWATLFQGRFRYDFGSDDPLKLDDSWLDEQELAHKNHKDRKQRIQAPERMQQKELPAGTQQKEYPTDQVMLTGGTQQKEQLAQEQFDRLIEKEKTHATQNHYQDRSGSTHLTPSPRAPARVQNRSAPPQQLAYQEPPPR